MVLEICASARSAHRNAPGQVGSNLPDFKGLRPSGEMACGSMDTIKL